MISANKNIDFFLISISQFFALIMNVWLISLLTKSLSVEMYGYYVLFFTSAIFLRQVIYDPISYVIVRDCGQIVADDVDKKIETMGIIGEKLLLWILVETVIVGYLIYVKCGTAMGALYVLTFNFYLFSNGAVGMSLAVLNILKKRKFYGLVVAVDGVLKVSILGAFFGLFGASLLPSVAALALTSLIMQMILRNYFKKNYSIKNISSAEYGGLVKEGFHSALPFYLPTFFVALKGVGERWVLAANVGVEDLAIFNVFFQLGFSPVVMIFGVVQTFVAPLIYRLSAEGGSPTKFVNFMLRLIGGVILVGVGGGLLADIIGPTLLKHIVPESYYEHLYLFPLFVVAGVMAAAVGIVHLGVVGAFEAKLAGKIMTIAMVLGISIALVSVLGWGFKGAIFGLIASNVVAFFIYSASLQKIIYKS